MENNPTPIPDSQAQQINEKFSSLNNELLDILRSINNKVDNIYYKEEKQTEGQEVPKRNESCFISSLHNRIDDLEGAYFFAQRINSKLSLII